jgi:hypothetical protein
MADLAYMRLAALDALAGPNPWDALEYLPPPISDPPEKAAPWKEASLADFFVIIECVQNLFDRLSDGGSVPRVSRGPHFELWRACHFNSATTIPTLLVAERLRDACVHASVLIRERHRVLCQHPGVAGLDALEALDSESRVLARQELLSWLISNNETTANKLVALSRLMYGMSAALASMVLDTAVTRWPSNMEWAIAMRAYIAIGVQTGIAADPQLLALTDANTWKKFLTIAEQLGTEYAPAVRHRLSRSGLHHDPEAIAIFDPTFALSVEFLRAIVKWFAAVEDEAEEDFNEAVEHFSLVLNRTEPSDLLEQSGRICLSDFVMASDGDGAWPSSVAEVEYIVRDVVAHAPISQFLDAPSDIVSAFDGKLFWLQTPWAMPVQMLNDPGFQEWQRRMPIWGWLMYSSSNPMADQNIFRNYMVALPALARMLASDAHAREVREWRRDLTDVGVPALIATGAMMALLHQYMPDVPTVVLAAIQAAFWPLVKLRRKRSAGN